MVGLILAVALCGCGAQASSGGGGGGGSNETRADEALAFARAIVQHEARAQEADISSATARVRNGTVTDSNVGTPCTSGRVLELKLIGSFPHLAPRSSPGEHGNSTVTALLITADEETGLVCLKGVQTGEVKPLAGAIHVPLA